MVLTFMILAYVCAVKRNLTLLAFVTVGIKLLFFYSLEERDESNAVAKQRSFWCEIHPD